MSTRIYRKKKTLRLLIIAFCFTLCLPLIGYRAFVELEYEPCYKQLGEKWNVKPIYSSVSKAIYNSIKEKLVPGMTADQANNILSQVAQTKINSYETLSDGSYYEKVELKVCSTFYNNIFLIVTFTKDDLYQDVWLDEGF